MSPKLEPDNDPLFLFDQPMEKALAYLISAGIIGFGGVAFVAGLGSEASAFWTCAALIPVAIGLLSTFGDC